MKNINGLDWKAQDEFYKNNINKFGENTPQVNGWNSRYSQVLRYDAIIQMIEKYTCLYAPDKRNDKKILDLGCGDGEMKNWLPSNYQYKGYDKREKFGNKDFLELTDSELKGYDYFIFSGSLVAFDNPLEIIKKFISYPNRGLVFNLLDEANLDSIIFYRGYNKQRTFSDVYNRYRIENKYIVLKDDQYMPNVDFTIGIFK